MTRQRLLLLAAVTTGGGGWFVTAWKVMGTDAGQAANEAVGAALGVLLLVAIVGVIRQQGPRAGG